MLIKARERTQGGHKVSASAQVCVKRELNTKMTTMHHLLQGQVKYHKAVIV